MKQYNDFKQAFRKAGCSVEEYTKIYIIPEIGNTLVNLVFMLMYIINNRKEDIIVRLSKVNSILRMCIKRDAWLDFNHIPRVGSWILLYDGNETIPCKVSRSSLDEYTTLRMSQEVSKQVTLTTLGRIAQYSYNVWDQTKLNNHPTHPQLRWRWKYIDIYKKEELLSDSNLKAVESGILSPDDLKEPENLF